MARIKHFVAPEAGLVLVTMEGPTNIDDCMEASRLLHADPRWDERYDVIWDVRRITDLNLVPGNIDTIVEEKRDREIGENVGVDVLVVSGLVEEAVAVLIRVLAFRKHQRAAVHHRLETALRELGHDTLPEALRQ